MWRVWQFARHSIHGIHNVVKWLPLLWRDRDYDWAFLARILEAKLRFMAKSLSEAGPAADQARSEMLLCAHILKRLQTEDYLESLPLGQSFAEGLREPWIWKHADSVRQADEQLLWHVFRRKMRTWWT